MKKNLLFFPILFLVIVLGILGNVIFNAPPDELSEDYINNEVLWMSTDSIDKILLTDSKSNFTSCICSVDEENLMFLLLENDNGYDMNFKNTFSVNGLSENPNKVLYNKVLLNSKSEIAYNIFLNPKKDTITVNGVECEVKKINYSTTEGDFTIGFWWYEME